ncbi:hypothetical protein Hdeb2414_s0007g00242621 [Helianthus debilis subsp. tardiflorus]
MKVMMMILFMLMMAKVVDSGDDRFKLFHSRAWVTVRVGFSRSGCLFRVPRLGRVRVNSAAFRVKPG